MFLCLLGSRLRRLPTNQLCRNMGVWATFVHTYMLNWVGRTSWEWWDEWDDTVLQTHVSKLEPLLSEAEHATSRSRRLSSILKIHFWALLKVIELEQLEDNFREIKLILLIQLNILIFTFGSGHVSRRLSTIWNQTTAQRQCIYYTRSKVNVVQFLVCISINTTRSPNGAVMLD